MTKTDLLQTEQEHHGKAFEIYHLLGARRTYQGVAISMGVSASAVKLWSRSFGWHGRLREREAEEARQIADRAFKQGLADTERNLKIVRAALMRLAKGIAGGQMKVQIGDLDRLIRLEEHLLSDPTQTVDASGQRVDDRVRIYLPENGRDKRPWETSQGDPEQDAVGEDG